MTAYQQACALVDVGRHAQATAVLRTALAETPGDAELLTLLAFTLRKQGEPAAALRACEAALAADPNLAEAHLEHAESLLSVMHPDEALAAAEQAVRLAPTWPRGYETLAAVHIMEHRLPEAQAAAEHALALAPQSVSALVTAGDVARYAGRFRDAERAVRAALAIDPENYDARFLFAMIDAERLRTRRSVRMLRGLARERPVEPNATGMTWPIRHLLHTLKRQLARATILALTAAAIGSWWAPAAPAARLLAAVVAIVTTGYSLLLLAPAGATVWRCLRLMPALMRRAAVAGLATVGVQVCLLTAYAVTGAWWLTMLAVTAAPLLWALDAAVTVGTGLADPGGTFRVHEVADDLHQWWLETRQTLRDAWREGGQPKT